MNSKFETALGNVDNFSVFKGAVVDVLDTADLVYKWAEERELATPELIASLTALIIKRVEQA